ncbi:MAG: hypothetical protein JO317_03320, partial [Verrucomicrobiae bacterium]|nr:hypothetical protein [Verrucomicrobiae bacterium]
ILVMAQKKADSPLVACAMETLGNVVVLPRPVSVNTLISTARMAIRSRRRQYQIREHLRNLLEQEKALARKAEALARSNADLEQFAYVASHDLQEPLRMIASYVQLLAKRYREKLDQTADEYIGFAVDGALRMQQLIEGMLEYARVGRDRTHARVSLSKALSIALDNLRRRIEDSRAEIRTTDLPTLVGDETEFVQLFQNLVGNALKFTRGESPRITIACTRGPAELVISVRDNGIGIDPQYHSKIFGIFQRLHDRKSYPGTGIGLALCMKIVANMGGHLSVESRLGEGSTFQIVLPNGLLAPEEVLEVDAEADRDTESADGEESVPSVHSATG